MKYSAKEIEGKLMLISKDIQVGDTIRYDNLKIPQCFASEMEVLLAKEYKSGAFKVIGHISPEAIWVKENDEFDEKDVKFTTPFLYRKNWKEIYRVGKEKETGREQQVRPYAPSFNIKRWEVLNPQLEDYIVQIKCRCCNKFV